jgi:drug/metabolite transporter (DMT)-like permease
VVAAAAATVAAGWLAGRLVHIDYVIGTPLGARSITLAQVSVATAIFGLAGWAVYGVLERKTSRARPLWITIAVVVLALSIVPIFALRAGMDTRLALIGLHCLAGAILIPGLPQTRWR